MNLRKLVPSMSVLAADRWFVEVKPRRLISVPVQTQKSDIRSQRVDVAHLMDLANEEMGRVVLPLEAVSGLLLCV